MNLDITSKASLVLREVKDDMRDGLLEFISSRLSRELESNETALCGT